MEFNLVGVNHSTTPITIREKIAISSEGLCDALSQLRSYVKHGVVLSTCNRTEIYTVDNQDYPAVKASLEFMKSRGEISDDDLLKYANISKGEDAAEHLFRVAGGLESMTVGEFEILGQVKQALDTAEQAGMVDLPLRHAFHSAIRTGRRVRNETGISKNVLSVSSVAVDLATRIVGNLKGCKMLIIGAGEAGRLVAKVATERGVAKIVIANRTKETAQALAVMLRGTPTDLYHLADELSTANIVVACAAAPHRILDVGHIEEAIKKRPESPMVIIDIAVPRNVAPEVAKIKNVFLYDIDDLTAISDSNRKQRETEIQHAEEVVASELHKFVSWWQVLEVRPVVKALLSKAEDIRSTQLNRTLKELAPLTSDELESLEAMTKSIVNKILKEPVHYLTTNGNGKYCHTVHEMFQLDK